MTTSGVNSFNPDITECVEEAFERCGGELRTGYDFRTARRSLNLLFADWANRGINLWTVDSGSIPLVAGTATYSLPAQTVDLMEHVIRTGSGTTQSELIISRIALPTYASIPAKNSTGRPIQVYINRTVGIPTITLWPIPDQTSVYTFVYWRLRRMYDANTGTDTTDVPFRFLPPMIAGLAYHLAMKVAGGMDRLPMLKAQYDEAWQMAADEDRDKSPIRLVPRQQYI
jgi:hypothetical protein